ncbi:hypothetical protein F4804DRAFT_353402 [Jackrogersella minutella]|nr:hypothetical protein F4804DRAFT_353402 [Jackrogersella minutella]
MSSSTGLSRTRSIRKPTTGKDDSGQRDGPSTRTEPRAISPSRLPVKPTMTTRSAAASSAATSSTTTSRARAPSSTITGRPTSIYGKTSTARTDKSGNATTTTTTKPPSRVPSSRPTPPITSQNRTASSAVSRPRSSGGPPATTITSSRPMGHTRSRSTVTSLTAATTLRPVSQTTATSSSSGRTSPPASTITTTTSKPQTRSQTRHHTRTKSQTQNSNAAAPSSAAAAVPSLKPPLLTSRPAFNTHQQHYSPAKSLAPKPLTSTYLAPPSPSKLPANLAISAETSRLQAELLQLSLLHRDAAAVDGEWHASACDRLGARFARLGAEGDRLRGVERRGAEARNVVALARWGEGSGLEEKIQILDEVLNGVWVLGEPGGRYARVAAGFEAWAGRMAAIVSAQRSGNVDVLVDGEEVRFLGELDVGWKHDCVGLQRKLEAWRLALRDLGDPSPPSSSSPKPDQSEPEPTSSLKRMVDGCRALVHDMLAELALMAQIERDAARAEDDWIERMNKAIEDEDDDTPAARAYVPLWKMAA